MLKNPAVFPAMLIAVLTLSVAPMTSRAETRRGTSAPDTQFAVYAGNVATTYPGRNGYAGIAVHTGTGFAGTVAISTPNLPKGITASASPSAVTASSAVTLTFQVAPTVAAGKYLITVDGATPGATQSTVVTLTVTAATLALSGSAPSLTVLAGSSGLFGVSTTTVGTLPGPVALTASGLPRGATASFSPATINGSGSATLSVAVPASTPTGAYPVKVSATAGSASQQLAFTLNVLPGNSSGVGPPTATSAAAALATAQNNAVCVAVEPFYLEIGDKLAPRLTASVGTDSTGAAVLATTDMSIASASKWIYGMYVVQQRGGVSGLTSKDISFLHFTSGYTNMGSSADTSTCPAPGQGADSIAACLTRSGPQGAFNASNPATTGVYDYDSGHEENHAGQLQPEISGLAAQALGPAIIAGLGLTGVANLVYSEPLLAGGGYMAANDYTAILRAVLSGQLLMHDALGTSPVCAWTGVSGTCNAAFSPIVTEHWHYSMAHWVEDDPTQNNDGAFSSPGAFGFYPWIEANKNYYGVIARVVQTGNGLQNGLMSAQCGALVRRAWDTGVVQTGTLPN